MKQLNRLQSLLVPSALVGYIAFTLLAYVLFPGAFAPSTNWLSDLGNINQNPRGWFFYNLGVFLTALYIAGFFVGISRWKMAGRGLQNRMVQLTQGFGLLGCAAMALSALYPINFIAQHRVFSIALYILLGTAFAFSVAALRYYARYPRWMLALGVLVAAIDMLSGFLGEVTLLEWITVSLFLVYLAALNATTRRVLEKPAAHAGPKKAAWLGLLLILMVGCSPLAPTPAAPVPTAAPSPTRAPAIDLKPCDSSNFGALCGTLRVVENRAAHSGRMIDLKVVVYKAQGANPAPDPIFFLSGGPGGAASEDAAKGQQFPFSLSENHDVVYVDQRGTGGSHRVVIPPSPDLSGLTQDQAMEKMKAWVTQFLNEIDMDPRYYTTSVAMDDLDEVRAALGYDKINLFGHSYGATAAQYYLRQHEDHVRSVILSGGALLDVPVFEVWAKNGQRALDLVFARCAADAACQAAFPNLPAEFAAINTRLSQQPKTMKFTNPADGQPASVTFSADYLAELLRVMMLDAKNAAKVPGLIHKAAAEDDWSGILMIHLTYGAGDWGQQIMERVIRCGEKWAAFDPQAVERLSAGSYLKGWYVSLAQSHALACQLTPLGEMPEGRSAQPHSNVPVLVMNGEADPQGPPENMAGYKELWPNSLMVVEPFQGHWLSDWGEIQCRWAIEDQFIQSGSVLGIDTSCMQNVQMPAFEK